MSRLRKPEIYRVFIGLALLPLLLAARIAAPTAILAQTDSTQEAGPVSFTLTVSNRSCALVPGSAELPAETPAATVDTQNTPEVQSTPEATTEATPSAAGMTVYTLGPDCDALRPLLLVPSNGTLWLSLTNADDPSAFLKLSVVEGDEYPPKLDRRGRYFGCAIPEQGDQVCQVMAEVNGAMYWIQIPVQVGAAYIAPEPTATPAPVVEPTLPATHHQPPHPNQTPGT